MLHSADVSEAELLREASKMQCLAPVLRRAFKRGSNSRENCTPNFMVCCLAEKPLYAKELE